MWRQVNEAFVVWRLSAPLDKLNCWLAPDAIIEDNLSIGLKQQSNPSVFINDSNIVAFGASIKVRTNPCVIPIKRQNTCFCVANPGPLVSLHCWASRLVLRRVYFDPDDDAFGRHELHALKSRKRCVVKALITVGMVLSLQMHTEQFFGYFYVRSDSNWAKSALVHGPT